MITFVKDADYWLVVRDGQRLPYVFGCRGTAEIYATALRAGQADDTLLRPCVLNDEWVCAGLHVVEGLI